MLSKQQQTPKQLEAVIMDLAGTCVDFGSRAPIDALLELFASYDVEISEQEARGPMGKEKREHILSLLNIPRVRQEWFNRYQVDPDTKDVDRLYHQFIQLQLKTIQANNQLIPGNAELLEYGKTQGVKFGVNTGYSREMITSLIPEMKAQGFMPDSIICASDVSLGRPAPWMSLKNAEDLKVSCVQACVKVDDTSVGIQEGLNAGMWTVAVTVSGNAVGLTLEQWQALTPDERNDKASKAQKEMSASGAHFVINTLADLPQTLTAINQKMAEGVKP